MDFLQKLTEVARPNHTELLPTCFVSQETLDSIRYTRWVGDPEEDTVSLVATLKNGKELFLMKTVPSEVMFSLIENHPSAPGGDRSLSSSRSNSLDEESASQGVYESDDEDTGVVESKEEEPGSDETNDKTPQEPKETE